MAMAERFRLEAKNTLGDKKLSAKQRDEMIEACNTMAEGFVMAANSLKPLAKGEKLHFGTRYYNGMTYNQRLVKAHKIIHGSSAVSGLAGFFLSPIPMAGPTSLTLISLAMLKKFSKDLYGKDLGVSMLGLASLTGGAVGPHLANQLWHMIPVAGQIIVAASEAASSAIMHQAFGWFYFALFEAQLKNGREPHMPMELSMLSGIAGGFFRGYQDRNPNHSGAAFHSFIDELSNAAGI